MWGGIIGLIIQLISGAVGGNIAGAAMEQYNLAKLGSRDRLKVRSRCGCLVRPPDALHRTHGNSDGLCHRAAGPVGRLVRWLGACQRHHPRRDDRRERRFAGLAGLVAQQTFDPLSGKRCCHRHTVGRLTPMLCATRCAEWRSAEMSTMRVRSTCLRGRLRSPAIAANCSRLRGAQYHTYLLCHGPRPHTMAQYRRS